jgi:DNA-binding beta-propeller fold protein YncE
MRSRQNLPRFLLGLLVVVTAAAIAAVATGGRTGEARLVAFEPLPAIAGETCEWEPAVSQMPSYAAAGAAVAQQLPRADARMAVAGRPPVRFIQDTYPSFSAIAVDPMRNEVVMTDENRFRVMVYDRLASTPASAEATQPKRVISGLHTATQFASDVYIDPPTGEIYVINNDTVHNTTIYGRNANGDVPPDREFVSPYGNFGVVVDEARQELYLTMQHQSAILIYKKSSGLKDQPIRVIQGDQTRMADPHGIAFDVKNRLLYVSNYGTSHNVILGAPGTGGRRPDPTWPYSTYSDERIPGMGSFDRPSITVLAADASGNVAPLRVIQGPKTGLNWPTGVALDPDRGELYVANEVGDTISVFSATAQGDVAPIRMLKGARTLMRNPSDVFLDLVNKEMWVASFGNHLALAYPLGASGDAVPVRIIRGSPLNTPGSLFGNPFGVAYDTKREEILVTSCVAHPRIGAFARMADKNALPVRAIEGSNTHLNRTMHAIVYDELHD